MNIYGVTHPGGRNNAACAIVDGQLVAFVEEERLTRLKHAPDVFPARAFEFCRRATGLSHKQIDATAVGFSSPPLEQLGADDFRDFVARTATATQRRRVSHLFKDDWLQWQGKLMRFDHHLAHAASALIPSGLDSANVISVDGYGGSSAGLLGWWKDRGEIEELYRIPNSQSWGVVFLFITEHLGFGGHSGEGKTMGLAPYGEVDTDLLPDFCDGPYFLPRAQKYAEFARNNIRPPADRVTYETVHKNIAATLQYYYHRSLIAMGQAVSEASGLNQFTMCGGVALNCTGNGVLAQQDFVRDLWVQPAAHDGGTALGAAILAHRELSGDWPDCRMEHAYWGPSYTDDEVLAALKYANVPYHEVESAAEVARALMADEIVGFFQGAAEVGPRALGNRSILANPGSRAAADRVNRDVKKREMWRPLAPSVLAEHYEEVFDAPVRSDFMIMAFQVRDEWRARVPAITHVDGSARPQRVDAATNPAYHAAIKAFHEQSGLPLVLNTSFNLNDEPLVTTPDQAIATFFRSGMDTLVIGNFAVRKREFWGR